MSNPISWWQFLNSTSIPMDGNGGSMEGESDTCSGFIHWIAKFIFPPWSNHSACVK
jgi:hypothetical protein